MGDARRFSASDEFVVWAQGLSGTLTKMKTRYGNIADMVEHRKWNEGKTTLQPTQSPKNDCGGVLFLLGLGWLGVRHNGVEDIPGYFGRVSWLV
jgi:hypothetical protein